MRNYFRLILCLLVILYCAAAFAVGERGALVRIVILETSRGWAHVEALLGGQSQRREDEEEERQGKTITGWLLDKGMVRTSTPDGDKILFGEATDSEGQASRRGGRKGADQDAMRLYYRVYDYFPSSPLAGEALYRAADITPRVP